ncbi:MAG: 30S ribosomal protein S16 [Chitinophagales bacterium]
MPVKIRLQRHGRKQRPFYHIVVADARAKRDGKFIERIGDYNPLTVPATINVDAEKAFKWVMDGAQPTDTVRKILTFKGVMYRKHLQRGVSKGAFTQEEADKKYTEWVEAKMSKIQDRIDKELKKIEDRRAKRNSDEAEKRAAKIIEATPVEEEVTEEVADENTEAAPTDAPVEETPAEEAAPEATEE